MPYGLPFRALGGTLGGAKAGVFGAVLAPRGALHPLLRLGHLIVDIATCSIGISIGLISRAGLSDDAT